MRITIFFLMLIMPLIGSCQSSNENKIIIEEIYSPNSELFFDSQSEKLLIIEKIYSNINLTESSIDITNKILNDYLVDFSHDIKTNSYYVVNSYVKDKTGQFLAKSNRTQLLKNRPKIENNYIKVFFTDSKEPYNECNDILKKDYQTHFITDYNINYGVVLSKKSKLENEKIHIIDIECTTYYSIDTYGYDIYNNKIRDDFVVLLINDTYHLIHNGNTLN